MRDYKNYRKGDIIQWSKEPGTTAIILSEKQNVIDPFKRMGDGYLLKFLTPNGFLTEHTPHERTLQMLDTTVLFKEALSPSAMWEKINTKLDKCKKVKK